MALTRNPSSAATVKPYRTMLVSIVIGGSTPVQVDVVAENTAGGPQSQEKPVSVLARPESGSVCQVDVAGGEGRGRGGTPPRGGGGTPPPPNNQSRPGHPGAGGRHAAR